MAAPSPEEATIPLLFDGHHGRASKKKRSKKIASRQHSTVTKCEYPMYAVAVPVLLTITELQPHQIMLQHGLLTRVTAELVGRIIFVSHEWTGFDHPDPKGEQLKALQDLLGRLQRGEEDGVQSNWMQQLGFKENVRVRAPEWKAALPHMFVWIDFACMPQPKRKQGKSAMAGSDHRHGGDLAAALTKAVRSIPSYVERTTLMLVLVPNVKHADRVDHDVCEFRSWRRRGWCRMELMCAWLARSEIHVLIAKGGNAAPEFVIPGDALFLPPGTGDFTCCARDHDFGDGPGTAPCDKHKVREVLDVMIDAKSRHLSTVGRLFEARYFAAMKHWFLRGLPPPSPTPTAADDAEADGSAVAVADGGGSAEASSVDPARRLERFKARMHWRSAAEEATETRRTGATLAYWAAFADEVEVLKEVLGASEARVQGGELERGLAEDTPGLSTFKGDTALHGAVCYGSWAAVETLLDAGADPKVKNAMGFNAMHVMASSGRADGIRAWMRRFPDWDLEIRESVAGSTSLLLAAALGPDKIETLEALVDAGADTAATSPLGGTILHSAAVNPDADADLVRAVFRLCPNLDVEYAQRPRALGIRVLLAGCRLAYRLGSRNSLVAVMAGARGATALHNAASIGNLTVVREMVEEFGADVTKRNTLGMTPLEGAAAIFGGAVSDVPVELRAALQ